MPDTGMTRAGRDIIVLSVAMAACVLFVILGGTSLSQAISALMGTGRPPDGWIVSGTVLNVALIIFSWRRYNELTAERGERCLAQTEARILSRIDPLTGCHNRQSISAVVTRLREQTRERNLKVAALLFDIDRFKQVNDINGHRVGDSLLVEMARRVSAVIPTDAELARLGGDEFCCFISFDHRQPDWVEMVAANILQAIAKPVLIDGVMIEVTASMGIAQTKGDTHEADEQVIHEADIAMYHAKKKARGLYDWFNPTMESELRFRNALETGIRKGIELGEFVPFYQKQVDLESGELVGFEMLARWRSATLGEVSPDLFIPVAEEIGVIAELSETLIRSALRDAKQWDPRLLLSVNISPVQLRDPWFSQKLLLMLIDEGFPPDRLEIEITESCLHNNIGSVRAIISSLENQGIRVSLDDFGTGYSSLAQLRSLPFDRLKIDRSFVTELAQDSGNLKLIEAIVSLGKGLNLPITAEGIENENVMAALRQLGGMKGQGFFYGAPQDSHTTQHMLKQLNLLARATKDAPAASPFPMEFDMSEKQAGTS